MTTPAGPDTSSTTSATISATTGQPAVLNTKSLYEALRAASRFLGARKLPRILHCILIDITPGQVSLTSTDYDSRFAHTFPVDTSDTARLAIPAADLTAAAKKLVARTPEVSLGVAGGDLILNYAGGNVRITGEDAGDYPHANTATWARPLSLTFDQWVGLQRVNVAVGTDDLLPVLTGIHLRNDAGSATSEATDRFRFAFSYQNGTSDDTWETLLPAKTLKAITEAFKSARTSDEDTVVVEVAPSRPGADDVRVVRASCGNTTVDVRPIEGEFPKLAALFGPRPTAIGTTSRAELAAAVAFAAGAVNPKTDALTLTFADDTLTVVGAGETTTITEKLPGTTGSDTNPEVHVNANILIQGLLALNGADVTLTRHKVAGPVRLDDADETFTYVAMTRRRASSDT